MSAQQQLLTRIGDRSAVAAVIGLGYVGLPLAMELCETGFTVVGFDVSESVCARLMRGESHIQDVPAAQVATHVASGKAAAASGCTLMPMPITAPTGSETRSTSRPATLA